MRRVLITGISGGLGRLVARRLHGRVEVLGVDRAPWRRPPKGIRIHPLDLRKKKFEDLIRTERPDAIVHLGFVRHFRTEPALRHEVNVLGTRRVLEYAVEYGVRQVVVFSSSYVYGALPENSYYLDEDAPLNVSRTYPEVRDLAEVDMLATAFLWRHPDLGVVVLRPVNILGPTVRSAISQYLRMEYVPTVLGFNPMMQFVHEEDVADAIVLALEHELRGIFNLVGPGAVPLHVAIRETGGVPVPLPEFVLRRTIRRLFRWRLFPFPDGAVDFVKYPCTLDGRRFVAETGFRPRHSLPDVFAKFGRGDDAWR
ncbi:MAG: NAD-dependent dehydratase [Candidatus Binatia bacterium]|nr:MAG: NAD-dependent dehydratase [Candidatus Binatia bacterium]